MTYPIRDPHEYQNERVREAKRQHLIKLAMSSRQRPQIWQWFNNKLGTCEEGLRKGMQIANVMRNYLKTFYLLSLIVMGTFLCTACNRDANTSTTPVSINSVAAFIRSDEVTELNVQNDKLPSSRTIERRLFWKFI